MFAFLVTMYSHVYTFGIFVFVAALFDVNSTPEEAYIRRQISSKYTQYQCWKLKTCQRGGPKVCGFCEERAELAVFEDMCTLHKANCRNAGLYIKIYMNVCDAKKDYIAKHGDTFEWEHISRPSTPGANRSSSVVEG